MKGVYPTLSHSLLLLLGLTAMSLIIASLYFSFLNTEKNLTVVELNFIADSVKNKILDVYSLTNQSSSFSTGLFQLNLPEKIGTKKYSLTLSQNKLFVNSSVGGESLEVSRDLTIGAELSGSLYAPASVEVDKQNGAIIIRLVNE